MRRHLQLLLRGLAPTRWEQHCAAPVGPTLNALEACAPGCCAPLALDDPPTVLGTVRAALALRGVIRRVQPDLLHGHGYRGMLVAALAARLCRRPFVFTAHTLPGELGPRFWKTVRPLCRGARGAVCVSRAVATELRRRLDPGCPPTRVVYNGIEPGPAPGPRQPLPADLESAGRRPLILTAARLAPQKGIATLIEAWAALASRYPDGLLLVAGDGPLRGDLEAQARALGIAPRVRFAGFREDVRALLAAADLAAIPSLQEGQSLFAVEAMAAGTPVVASTAGGLAEMVREGETGLSVPPGDATALAAALARLLDDAALAAQLRRDARAFVETELSIERMLARMDEFYAAVVNGIA